MSTLNLHQQPSLTVSASHVHTVGISGTSLNPTYASVNNNGRFRFEDKIEDIEKKLVKINNRLCILDEPSTEVLEKHKSLKRAYEEYLVLEKLVLGDTSGK